MMFAERKAATEAAFFFNKTLPRVNCFTEARVRPG
jgi:hypothetical protein